MFHLFYLFYSYCLECFILSVEYFSLYQIRVRKSGDHICAVSLCSTWYSVIQLAINKFPLDVVDDIWNIKWTLREIIFLSLYLALTLQEEWLNKAKQVENHPHIVCRSHRCFAFVLSLWVQVLCRANHNLSLTILRFISSTSRIANMEFS